MVDLTNITTQELFTELAKRKDGKAYLELAFAKQKLDNVVKDAQDKKGEEILDFLTEEFCSNAECYQDEFPYIWQEVIAQDEETIIQSILENEKFAKLLSEYMDLVVG